MCIICVSRSGVRQPGEATMVFMGENSRSGGKAVSLDDVVDIRGKSLEALEDACEGDDAF